MDATNLSEVWETLTAAGATIHEWCEEGVSTGDKVIFLGPYHLLAASDSDGYSIHQRSDCEGSDFVPSEEYDEDQALREASDLEGYFGVVGIPGSQHHDFEWFSERVEAQEWANRAFDKTLSDNPTLGTIEAFVLTAAKAFDCTYQDGNRVYFRPKNVGPGFSPKGTEVVTD
jgi:hypothetical protein